MNGSSLETTAQVPLPLFLPHLLEVSETVDEIGNQIELVLLITASVIALVSLMTIGICCCLPSSSGLANEEESEILRRQSPSNPNGYPYKQTATDPRSKSTKTTGTSTTGTSKTGTSTTGTSTTKISTVTKLDTFFTKSDRRYIPPPSGPPSTKDKVKISKLNNRKGPAPQPPKTTSPKTTSLTGRSPNMTPSKESGTYASQMKPTVKSHYSIFHRGQGSSAGYKPNAINKSSPTKDPSFRPLSSSSRTRSPTPSGPRTESLIPPGSRTGIQKQASVIKRTVTPFVPEKKDERIAPEKRLALDKRMSNRNVTEVPTVQIAPSDHQHVFSSKEVMEQRQKEVMKQRQKEVMEQRPGLDNSPVSQSVPRDDTTSTCFRLSSQRSRSRKRPAPQPPQLVFNPNPPPAPCVFPPKAPVTTKTLCSLSLVSEGGREGGSGGTDSVIHINNPPGERLFKTGRGTEQDRACQALAEGERVPTEDESIARVETGPPTIGEQSRTDPKLEEVNQTTNPEDHNQEDHNPEGHNQEYHNDGSDEGA